MGRIVRPQYQAALGLAGLGLSVIPIHHPGSPEQVLLNRVGKAPLVDWDAFKSCRPTDQELRAWFDVEAPRNFGIVCGRVSGVVVVDCDDEDGRAIALDCLPATPVQTITAKGLHLFYRYPSDAE